MQDAVLSHRSLRLLADQLAAAGYCSLRFDLPGTADACDDAVERDGGHWQAWQNSVARAADWLHETTGARRLVLCGLRVGATLAALAAAEREDVAGLVLFEPVSSGRNYLRRLLLEAELVNGKQAARESGIELREFHISPQTLEQIGGVDLCGLAIPAAVKIALFAQPGKATEEAAAAWEKAGNAVTRLHWNDVDALLNYKFVEEDSLPDFKAVIDWLEREVPAGQRQGGAAGTGSTVATLSPVGAVERPLRFGAGNALFGMLCQPASDGAKHAVIMCNANRNPHYGGARQSVMLARRLAEAGVASLRLDFGGIGDSDAAPGQERALTHVFRTDRAPDIRAAVDALAGLGFESFSLQGLCSGAFHAFRGALAEPRVSSLMLVNVPMFAVPHGNVLSYLQHGGMTPRNRLRNLFRLKSWTGLFSDRRYFRIVMSGFIAGTGYYARRKLRDAGWRLVLVEKHTASQQSMAELSKRGVRTLFVFSPDESLKTEFGREFGMAGEGLARYPGAEMVVIEELDHDMVRAAGRRLAIEQMVRFAAAAR